MPIATNMYVTRTSWNAFLALFSRNVNVYLVFPHRVVAFFSFIYSTAKLVNIWCGTELGKRRGREESPSCWSRGGRPGLRWRQPRTYCVSSKCPTTSWIVVCRYHSYYYSTIGLNSYKCLQVQRTCIVLYFIISYSLIQMKRSRFIQLVSASTISWLTFLC